MSELIAFLVEVKYIYFVVWLRKKNITLQVTCRFYRYVGLRNQIIQSSISWNYVIDGIIFVKYIVFLIDFRL